MGEVINRGSEWRKWDLHIHSLYTRISGCGSYKGVTDEKFIEKIRNEGISVVGLTNYFKFSDEDFELAEKMRKNGITTFMNLEFRLTNLNNNDKLADYHVIFSDLLSKSDIETFIANLGVTVGSKEEKINNLTDEQIRNNAAISFDKIIDTINDPSLNIKDKCLTAFLSRGHGNCVCGKGRGYTVYETIARKSDLLLHSSDSKETLENDKNYWLGKSSQTNEYIKPLLQSSDAHCLDNIGFKVKKVTPEDVSKSGVFKEGDDYFIKVPAFTWIKSDTTFEGLKQIIYEPEERIGYGVNNPNSKLDYMVIDYFKFNGEECIYFSEGLNSVIGGRSTGKSTLLNSIAAYQKNKNFNTSEHHIFKDNFEVVWKDGSSEDSRAVEFIPQEFMIDISRKKEKFNELLGEIIAKKKMDKEEQVYKEETSNIFKELAINLKEYSDLLSFKMSKLKPEGDKEAANASIKDIENRIEKIRLEHKFSEDENNYYKELCNQRVSLLKEIELLKKEQERLEFIRDVDFSVNIVLDEFSTENKDLITGELKCIQEESTQRWIKFVEGMIDNVKIEVNSKSESENKIENDSTYIRGKALESKNEELKSLELQIETHRTVVKKLEEYTNECSKIERSLCEKYESILDKFAENMNAIKRFCDNFKIEEKDLKIEIRVTTTAFEDKIKYLRSNNADNIAFIDAFNQKIKDFAADSFRIFIKEWLTNGKLIFNQNKGVFNLFNDIFTTNWYGYDYLVTYQDDEFQDMSQGKKSFVILKLLLEFSDDKKPVLIDQPEDSLDNRAIYYELRQYLLETKKNRQIIVVTHNPNVVVGADAENVIVAHQQNKIEKNSNGKEFQYINGSLENTKIKDMNCEFILESQGIREHIFDVLEGGREAFKKREQRYSYTNYNS